MASKPSKTEEKKETPEAKETQPVRGYPRRFISALADEVASIVVTRLPSMIARTTRRRPKTNGSKKIEKAYFLDTSAIIDGRIFEVINLGLMMETLVVPEGILLELKHIADSQDAVKRERGRKGLEMLDQLKKNRDVKVLVLPRVPEKSNKQGSFLEVDEELIRLTKTHKGRIITCDYNLEKKASIQGVRVVNVNALAQSLKVTAVPGESLHIKVLHQGKEVGQGVGYVDDGTMIVIEQGMDDIGKTVDVVVSRVIQTAVGRILFAKKIS